MIKIFRTIDGQIHQLNETQEGCWVVLADPTDTEILDIANKYNIDQDHLRAPLDEAERARIEVEDDYILILVDIPVIEKRNNKEWFGTIPLGIIVTDTMIFTVCLEKTPVLDAFLDGRMRNFYTYKRTRFILQILYRDASMFLHYLRIIDKKSEIMEKKLHGSPKNQELIELLEMEKSLVYFTTSLRGNEVVLEKLMKMDALEKFPEDTDLLEDVIIENKQAIEMAHIYTGVMNGMMDAFSSVISNNLNYVMKFMAAVTIVMAIPTMVFSAYGMNTNADGMPFSKSPFGFWIIIAIALFMSLIVALICSRKDLF